jgi:hypothetical protein
MVAELRSGEPEPGAADGDEELKELLPVGRIGSGLIGFLL